MIIESVRLINVKSFVDQELRFSRGITIIAGRNGAGKSTVIEAVGLALFGAWPEKFRDGNAQTGFIRRGEKEGEIRIVVETDGVRSTVICELGLKKRKDKEATVEFDRVLLDENGAELASSSGAKAEFQEMLRARVIGAARIDDTELFRRIIGTEQGMFDAPFIQPESERKRLFERILGISDFQKFERQFAALVKHLQGQAGTAKAQSDVLRSAPSELREAQGESAAREREWETARAVASGAYEAAAHARAMMREREKQREETGKARTACRLAEQVFAAHEKQIEEAQQRLEKADEAVRGLDAVTEDYRSFLATEEELSVLRIRAEERNRMLDAQKEYLRNSEVARTKALEGIKGLERDAARVRDELVNAETQRAGREAEIAALQLRREEASREVDAAEKEHRFYEILHRYALDLNATKEAIENTGATVATLRDRMRGIEAASAALHGELPAFTGPAFLSGVKVEAEYLFAKVFEARPSPDRDSAFTALLADLAAAHAATSAALHSARNTLQDAATAERVQRTEIRKLEDEQKKVEDQAVRIKTACDAAEADLHAKEEEWARQAIVFGERLRVSADVEARILRLETEKKMQKPSYESYLALKPLADTRPDCEAALHALQEKLEVSRMTLDALRASVAALEQTFSEEDSLTKKAASDAADRQERDALVEAKKCETRFEEQRRRVEDLEKQSAMFDRYNAEAMRFEGEATFFGIVHKQVVRSLAQSVGSAIVAAVSTYANELYQAIAPEQKALLAWDPDTYGIELQRGTTRIRGRELSGGQLMGVSLAIKLALIKWYSQCRIGFLDEPTTHLDAQTREHLAMMIGNLNGIAGKGAWFDQLFVVSHEESFGGVGRCIELAGDGTTGSRVLASDR